MKLNTSVYLLAMALALTSGVTGCKKKTTPLTPLPNPASRSPAGDDVTDRGDRTGRLNPDDEPGSVPMNPDLANLDAFNQDRATLAANTVHFAYDSAAIRTSEQPHVEAVASHLKSSGASLLIEGHCDERGTEEYNRALGERRALTLRGELIKLGCDGGKIVTRSFGKDRPVDTGTSEAAHSRNRRGEFVVLTPK